MVTTVRKKFGYDDTLDAFGVHGMGGAVLTGVFATSAVNQGLKDAGGHLLPLGLVDGKPFQVLNQTVGVLIAWAVAIVGSIIVLKICDMLLGVRVSAEQETEGLDLSLHGEEGYNLEA